MTLQNSNIKHIVKEIVFLFTDLFFCVISTIKKKIRGKACGALAPHSPHVHPPLKPCQKRLQRVKKVNINYV